MRNSFLILSIVISGSFGIIQNSYAQKWQPGRFTDNNGNQRTGMIWINPSGRSPKPDENFIEFQSNAKEQPYKISASDLKSFVIGRDSFVVAAEPQTGSWQYGVDFVKVVLDEDVNLYVFKGNASGSYSNSIEPDVEAGVGGGTGGYGGGVGIGLTIPIGHGGRSNRTIYYYGENTAQMHILTNLNFVDIMSNIMGDEPDVVEAIRENKYDLGNINKLVAYFNKVQASHTGAAVN